MIGLLRDLVDIYDDTSDDTEENLEYVGLPAIADIPAAVEHVDGHEKGQDTFVMYEVTFHYLTGITTTQQVHVKQGPFAGETLGIGEVETVRKRGRPMWTKLHCSKVS